MHIPPGWQRMIKTPPGWYQMQIPLGWCKGAGDPPRQCKGCTDSSGIADDSDSSKTAQGKNRSFQNGRNADSPTRAAQRLVTPTGPHGEVVPSEVVQGTLCGSTD